MTLNWAATQPVRGGASVNVDVTSSNPAIGAITISPIAFTGNQSASTTQFDPIAQGSTIVTVGTPAGFSPPSNFRQITATITP